MKKPEVSGYQNHHEHNEADSHHRQASFHNLRTYLSRRAGTFPILFLTASCCTLCRVTPAALASSDTVASPLCKSSTNTSRSSAVRTGRLLVTSFSQKPAYNYSRSS